MKYILVLLACAFLSLTACQIFHSDSSSKRKFLYQTSERYSLISLEIESKGDVTAEIYSRPNQKDYDIYFIGQKKGNQIEGLEHQSDGDRVIKHPNLWILKSNALVRNHLTYQEI